MEKISAETAVKELTLTLMYLTRFNEKNRFYASENNAWKGYPFKVLDELDETGFISQGSYRSKSIQIRDAGVAQAKILLDKYNIRDWEE